MSLENLFEDFEAQFAAQADRSSTKNSASTSSIELDAMSLLKLHTAFGETRVLSHPIIGLDFVAGIHVDLGRFSILRNQTILELTATATSSGQSKPIQKVAIELVEFIDGFREAPVRVLLTSRFSHASPMKGWLIGRHLNLLELSVNDEVRLIPIQSIAELQVISNS